MSFFVICAIAIVFAGWYLGSSYYQAYKRRQALLERKKKEEDQPQ